MHFDYLLHLNNKRSMKLFALALSLFSLTHLTGQLRDIDLGKQLAAGETYGTYCGFAGTPPEARKLIEDYIAKGDVTSIEGWLDSPSLVHQAYAVEAIIRLYNDGTKINEEVIDLVRKIKSKDDKINTCNGCVVGQTSMSSVLSDWTFKKKITP